MMREKWPSRQALDLGDLTLDSGEVLHDARFVYRVIGDLGSGRDVVLVFSYFTGTDESYAPWIGQGLAFDPARCTIVIVNHFGGGVSSSPSNTPGAFPSVGLIDDVRAASILLDRLGVSWVALAAGWSLGGMQAIAFAATHPDRVGAVVAVCSAGRCGPINGVFLDSVAAALGADPATAEGRRPIAGLNAFGRVYAGWAYSEAFFAEEIYLDFGYTSPNDVVEQWGLEHEQENASDLMIALRTWRSAGAIGFTESLQGVTAQVTLMPSSTDRYFTVAENEYEAGLLPDARIIVLDSPLGHIAGRPGIRSGEQSQIDAVLAVALESAGQGRDGA